MTRQQRCRIRGSEVQCGDVIELFGTLRQVTGLEPYHSPFGPARIAHYVPGPTSSVTVFDDEYWTVSR